LLLTTDHIAPALTLYFLAISTCGTPEAADDLIFAASRTQSFVDLLFLACSVLLAHRQFPRT